MSIDNKTEEVVRDSFDRVYDKAVNHCISIVEKHLQNTTSTNPVFVYVNTVVQNIISELSKLKSNDPYIQ